jgi:uroporphyrinogen-III synthase
LRNPEQRPIVALLESRMRVELSRLVEKHGGDPICAPALREAPSAEGEDILSRISLLSAAHYDVVVFMTGVAASVLFDVAERAGRRHELVAGLARITSVARGPKPTAALRGFGVPPTITAREPFTSAELLDALSELPLAGQRVLLFHYGERSATLAETLRARHALLDECWLYRWQMPDDLAELERLVLLLIRGDVDALAITCQVQLRHLLQVARGLALEAALTEALRHRVVIAVMGPTCHAYAQLLALPVHVMPEQPKMGPLVRSLMLYLQHYSHTFSRDYERQLAH